VSSAAAEVAYLARALKAPRVPEAARVLAERARDESWGYEAYLAAVLSEEVSSRETHGGQARVKRARFPQVKTLDDFDFTFQRSVKRQQITPPPSSTSWPEANHVVFLGPPGTGKTHLSIALGVQGGAPRPSGRVRHRPRVGPTPG
jgi:DNA replication protein DnaC